MKSSNKQREKAAATLKSCGYKNGGKVVKLAAGGAAKTRKGVSTPAGTPKKPSMPPAKQKMTLPKTKGK